MEEDRKVLRVKSIFQRATIRQQIMGSMTVVCGVSLLILGIIIFGISKKTIESNYQNAHEYNLQVSSQIIEIQLRSIVEQVRSLLIHEGFKEYLKEGGSSTYFSSKSQIGMMKVISNLASQDQMITSILVVNEGGSILYFSKNQNYGGIVDHYYDSGSILKEPWVEAAKQALGKEIFYGYNVLTKSENDHSMSLVKNLIEPYTGKSMGYLVVQIRKALLDKAFGTKKEEYETNRYLIIEPDDLKRPDDLPDYTVYYNGDEKAKEEIVRSFEAEAKQGKYLFSSYRNDTSGWEIVNVVEKRELSRDSSYIGWVILAAGSILILASAGISKAISSQISKPLGVLAQTISEVGEGNRKVEADFENNEIGRIGNKFKAMVNNNLELRERLLQTEIKEREAELLLLQSQINPHFLYNTLDSLYFMAVINKADDIARMVLALSNTFKLSLNKGGKLIRVQDEIEKMKAYMEIQNLRYHDRFEFRLEVEEEILKERILTFILQPFIENAMYHGLEAKIGEGYIQVTGQKLEKSLCFVIRDNGVGIGDRKRLEEGYGVSNVRERIRLFYGDGYGVSFDSRVGEGTTVRIIVPVLHEEA